MRLLLVGLAIAAASIAAACTNVTQDPLKLEGNLLTVDNRSSRDWTAVEIWLNTHYRVTVPSIHAGGRFQVRLDSFVAGFGQRFDFHRMQVTDLRLTAKLPDGSPLEVKHAFQSGGLASAFGRKPGGVGTPRKNR
jgi:hypothetical protein